MAPAAADRPHFPEMAARAFQDDSGRREPQVRPRRPAANRLQLAAYMHLSAPDGRGRLLPDREKLPHQCRDDRKVLRGTYQDGARCRRDQHHETETEKETKPAENSKSIKTSYARSRVNSRCVLYDRQLKMKQPRGRGGMAYAADLRKT